MKAVIISGALAQDHEFIYPYYRVLEAGFDLDVCIIGGKPVVGFLGTTLPPNKDHKVKDIHEIKPKDYDLLILPGGVKSMELLRLDNNAIEIVKKFNQKNKLIAAICSGTMMLISANIIQGKKVTGYYAWKQDIVNAGGMFVDEPSVEDGNIITSPHYKYNGEWMKSVIAKLKN